MATKNYEEDTVCRVCGSEGGSNNIFETKVCQESVLLSNVYNIITGLKISEDDGFPKEICKMCQKRLEDAYILREIAWKSLKLFKDFDFTKIKNEYDTDDSNSDWSKDSDYKIERIEIVVADEEDLDECGDSTVDAVEFLCSGNTPAEAINTQTRKQRKRFTLADKKHECQVCHKKFLRKSNLVDHLRLHANVKLFKCEYCDKAFVQSGNYKSHLRIHTNERPFVCNICFKSYNQSSALKIHIRSHTNERNYICEVCGKAFTNSSDLSKHKRVHDPSKQFKCSYCKRTFAQKSNLRLHEANIHTGKKYLEV